MSEETVDIHIRLSRDGADMLTSLMEWGNYTSKSAYIEEMIMAIEDIFAAFDHFHKTSEKATTDRERNLTWVMFSQYLVALLRRLGFQDYRISMKESENG